MTEQEINKINNEFSSQFDTLYNNITSNQSPGLDEYEKSVFLTKAQDNIIESYNNPRSNKVQLGFDDSKGRQVNFSSLMKTVYPIKNEFYNKFDERSVSYIMPSDLLIFVNESCSDDSNRYVVQELTYSEYDRLMLKPYQNPVKRGIWRLIVDSNSPGICKDSNLSIYNTSLKTVEFVLKLVANPSQDIVEDGVTISKTGIGNRPIIEESDTNIKIVCEISNSIANTSRYWQQFIRNSDYSTKYSQYTGSFSGNNDSVFPAYTVNQFREAYGGDEVSVVAPPANAPHIELIGRFNKDSLKYSIRYLRRPSPIVLCDLSDGLSINGVSTASACELDPSLFSDIIQRGVEFAKAVYTGDLNSQVALGQSSQTEVGMLTQSR